MRCEEAAEFVSALCDGERVRPEAAEHIGQCETCRTRLHDYIFAGAELRRAASLDSAENVPGFEFLLVKALASRRQRAHAVTWWKKGGEAMKIPRFAFMLMVLLIIGLSSGLVVVRARSNAQGPAVLLTLKLPNSDSTDQCVLSTNGDPKTGSCEGMMQTNDGGALESSIQFLSKRGDQIVLGVRSKFVPPPVGGLTFSAEDLKSLPLQRCELTPGQSVKIEIAGLGEGELTAQVLDHMPALLFTPKETLDPGENEIRMISPLLLQDRQVVMDMGNASVIGTEKNGAAWMYEPGAGRLIVSTENFPGAVAAQVNQSRIDFQMDGRRYQLLAGAPITRVETVWVRFDPNFRSSVTPGGGIGAGNLQHILNEQ
jgi:hypothetical protein